MKFVISRTSMYDEKPCEEARFEKTIRTDERTFKSFEEHDQRMCFGARPQKPWLEEGFDHRVTKEGIARDFDTQAWVIEIPTLEALVEFSNKYGQLVVESNHWESKEFPTLEIYDDYRE